MPTQKITLKKSSTYDEDARLEMRFENNTKSYTIWEGFVGDQEDMNNTRSFGFVGLKHSETHEQLLSRIENGEIVTVLADYIIKPNIEEKSATGTHVITFKFLLVKEILP